MVTFNELLEKLPKDEAKRIRKFYETAPYSIRSLTYSSRKGDGARAIAFAKGWFLVVDKMNSNK